MVSNYSSYCSDREGKELIFRLSNDIDQDWDFAVKTLKPVFCRTFQVDKVEDYYSPFKAGIAQLWIAEDAGEKLGVVVTQQDRGSQGSVLLLRMLGGKKLAQWAPLMEESLTEFARLHGCHQIEAYTRRGFSRLVESFKRQRLELFIKVV